MDHPESLDRLFREAVLVDAGAELGTRGKVYQPRRSAGPRTEPGAAMSARSGPPRSPPTCGRTRRRDEPTAAELNVNSRLASSKSMLPSTRAALSERTSCGRMEMPDGLANILQGCTMASFTTNDVEHALAPLAGDPIFQRLRVSEFRPEFGEDWNGNPAIWVYVLIPDDVPSELVRGPHFEEIQGVRAALEAAGWDGPVYTRFRRVSEDLWAREPAASQ